MSDPTDIGAGIQARIEEQGLGSQVESLRGPEWENSSMYLDGQCTAFEEDLMGVL